MQQIYSDSISVNSIPDYLINSNNMLYSHQQSESALSQLTLAREEKEILLRKELITKCEEFFNDILVKLKNVEKLEISILDLEKNSRFNYDKGCYTLELSEILDGCIQTGESIKYLNYNIYDHSEKLARLIKIISIIYNKALNNNSMTKRELYYNDVELFKNTQNIDTILHDICSLFNMSRFELSIFPAQKGLFAGDIIIYDNEGNTLNNSKTFDKINLISFEYIFEDIRIETNAKFILVVEKESLFFNLIGNKIYQEFFLNSIIVTGKGFPDYLTKYFLRKIANLMNIPIFYFGDFDPSGFEIYLNYLFGCRTSVRENELMSVNCINWIGLSYENILNLHQSEGLDSLTLIGLEDKDFKKIDVILQKEYFYLEAWDYSTNPFSNLISKNLQNLYFQLEKMRESKFRAEGELIISKYMNHFVNYVNFVLINF